VEFTINFSSIKEVMLRFSSLVLINLPRHEKNYECEMNNNEGNESAPERIQFEARNKIHLRNELEK
jgi:hypothetical protein